MAEVNVQVIHEINTDDVGLVLFKCGKGIYRLEAVDCAYVLTRLDRSNDPYEWGEPLLSLDVETQGEALAIAKEFVAEVESKA